MIFMIQIPFAKEGVAHTPDTPRAGNRPTGAEGGRQLWCASYGPLVRWQVPDVAIEKSLNLALTVSVAYSPQTFVKGSAWLAGAACIHEAANQLGIASFDSGRFEEAAAAYGEAVRLQPGEAAYHMNLGFAYFQLKRYVDTVAEQEQALRLDPTKAAAANSLGNARYSLGNYREAVAAYQLATRLKPNDALYLTNGGYALIKLGRLDEARKVREQVQVLDRKLAETLQAAIDKAGPASPTTTPLQSTAQRTVEGEIARGQMLYESRDYNGAIAAFQAAMPLTPHATVAARAFRWIGDSCGELGNYDQSIAAVRESLRLDPKDARAWNMLGVALTNLYKDEDALPAFQEAARLEPKGGNYQFNVGSTLVALGRLDEARKVLAVLQPLDKALALELKAQIHRTKPPTPDSSN
jgi:superkiller protein 3